MNGVGKVINKTKKCQKVHTNNKQLNERNKMNYKHINTQDIKLMIIENFIDNFTSDEKERKKMKIYALEFVHEDHVDEIAQSLEYLTD